MRRHLWTSFTAIAFAVACGGSGSTTHGGSDPGGGDAVVPGDSDGSGGGGDTDVPPLDERYRNVLRDPNDLAFLSKPDSDVKYLARVEGAPVHEPIVEPCTFQNMNLFDWHLAFLRSFEATAELDLDTYVQLVLAGGSRVWWGGALRLFPNVRHPTSGALGIIAYSIYANPSAGPPLSVDQIAEVDGILRACAPFAASLLAFVPGDPAQQELVIAERPTLAGLGVATVLPPELAAGIPFEAYSLGEGYGTLRIVPEGQLLGDYGPTEVIVVQSAPNDISIVSGLVTAELQSPLSHVNLRLGEKRIPSAALPDVYDSQLVRALDGFLVHVVVRPGGVLIEPASLEAAEAFWRANRPRPGSPSADLTVTALGVFGTGPGAIGHDDADAYGAKAANLGELHRILPAEQRVDGFGIPFAVYRDFITGSGIDAEIDAMLQDPRMRSDATFKAASLRTLRQRIRSGPLPSAIFAAVRDQMIAVFGAGVATEPTRFRSSTNVEDLEEITGAGLYDSRSGCLADDLDSDLAGPSHCMHPDQRIHLEAELARRQQELAAFPERTWLTEIIADLQGDLTEERTIERAILRVYSSLWNERAYDEREYYGIDHHLVYMGVAVNPTFVLEQANAVVITQLGNGAGLPLYRVVSQVGEESVVRPDDPLLVPEVLTFRRNGSAHEDVQVLVPSSEVAPGGMVWPAARLAELASAAFAVHDHFAANVYPEIVPLHLDLEVKLTRDDRVVIKQARPYLVFDPTP